MKRLQVLASITSFLCFLISLLPISALGQERIELQGRRIYYQGEVVKKMTQLEAIIQQAHNEEANQLFQKHKANVGTATSPTTTTARTIRRATMSPSPAIGTFD